MVNADNEFEFLLYWKLFTNVVALLVQFVPLFQYCVKLIGVPPVGVKLFSESQ